MMRPLAKDGFLDRADILHLMLVDELNHIDVRHQHLGAPSESDVLDRSNHSCIGIHFPIELILKTLSQEFLVLTEVTEDLSLIDGPQLTPFR